MQRKLTANVAESELAPASTTTSDTLNTDSASADEDKLEDKLQEQREQVYAALQPLGEQLNLAIAESDQAVETAIEAFKVIAAESQLMSECTNEMMRWRSDTNPVLQSTLTYLLERSTAISQNTDRVVICFQFQDILRQRLEHAVRLLDHLPSSDSKGAGNCPPPADFTHTPETPQPELF